MNYITMDDDIRDCLYSDLDKIRVRENWFLETIDNIENLEIYDVIDDEEQDRLDDKARTVLYKFYDTCEARFNREKLKEGKK